MRKIVSKQQPLMTPRVVSKQRPLHIFDWDDRSPAAEPLSQAPIGFCGRRVEVAGVNSAVEVGFYLNWREVNDYRAKNGLKPYHIPKDVCPACEAILEQGVPANRFTDISEAIAPTELVEFPAWQSRSNGWLGRRLAS